MARVLLILALFLSNFSLKACDVCGCSLSGGGIGLLSVYGRHTVGLRYGALGFQGNLEQSNTYFDRFTAAELYARYQFLPKWSVSLFQSYRWNTRTRAEEPLLIAQGLGDTRLFANFAVLNNRMVGDEKRLHWELRLGASLPTGSYDADLFDKNLPDNFNPGRGAFGWMVQSGMVYTFQKWGLSWDLNGQFYLPTDRGYDFGNEWSAALLLFREFSLGSEMNIKPFLGTQAEIFAVNRYANENAVHGTGGQGAFANTGFQFQYQRWMFSANVQLPYFAAYAEEEVRPDLRISCQLNYLF